MAKEGDIPWASNNNYLIWRLLDHMQKPENYKTLFGKKPGQVCFEKLSLMTPS